MEQVVTNAGKETEVATDDTGTDDVSAADGVAEFQDKIMTGLGEFYKELDNPSVQTYPARATRHVLLFPEGEQPIYIKGISKLQTYFNVPGNAQKL